MTLRVKPAVAMAGVCRPDEMCWSGPVSDLAHGVATLPAGAPIIIGIGAVFGARNMARRQVPPALAPRHAVGG